MSSARHDLDIFSAQCLIQVALGHEKADLVLQNATYLNVFSNTWETGDIAIYQGVIAGIGEYTGKAEICVDELYVAPGFIDGHIHLESSLVSPDEFARAALPHGTTAVVADPHEIANVLGTEGIEYVMQATEGLPLDVWLMLPSCVPATQEDESGATLSDEDIFPYLSDPRVLGLAEMMNYPGVLSGTAAVLAKLDAAKACGKRIDGHAPFLNGHSLNAYIASGISSDHECSTFEEAMEKLQKGQWIMIREGTAAQNLEALMPLLAQPYADRCMFVSDDKHPEDLLSRGHMDGIVAKAVRLGANPITALKAASFQPARAFDLKGYGAIAPGYVADLIVLKDLVSFEVQMTLKKGQTVYDGQCIPFEKPAIAPALKEKALHTFHMPEVSAQSFARKEPAGVVQMVNGQLTTENGGFADRVDSDVLKIAVLERHHTTGHIGIGYLKGYGLTRGAVATSIAHDSHNLIVVGTNDEDMACAANRVCELRGGIVIAVDGGVADELALPIAGLMSEDSLEQVNATLERLKAHALLLGVNKGIDPFMTLSFMSLPVIPTLRILTHGVFDVSQWNYMSH